MSSAPWMITPEPPDSLYQIVTDSGPNLENQLNALAQYGYRIVGIIPADGDTVSRIILERVETFSLTEQGDQAVSETLST